MKRLVLSLLICISYPFICLGQSTISVDAQLEGRTLDKAGLRKPSVTAQEYGIVVIRISVDQYGAVRDAYVDSDMTTIKEKLICESAKEAALSTGFNMSSSAPKLQKGIITYRFGELAYKDTSLKELVESYNCGKFKVTAKFLETYDSPQLIVLVEDQGYIIPVKLLKDDLGAEKRFRELNLKGGDSVTVCGHLDRITIDKESFKGLTEARLVVK